MWNKKGYIRIWGNDQRWWYLAANASGYIDRAALWTYSPYCYWFGNNPSAPKRVLFYDRCAALYLHLKTNAKHFKNLKRYY